MAKAAIIDIGTNTFHLLLVDYTRQSYTVLHREKQVVKLGKGGMQNQRIEQDAVTRALQALHLFAEICQSQSVERIDAFATSAVRSASNGKAFIALVKKETGIVIEQISGTREAELIYKGIRSFVPLGKEVSLLIDIGGGSTEFIIGNKDSSLWSKSFNLGVARMKETLPSTDPISPEDYKEIKQELSEALTPLWSAIAKWKPKSLIGSSGTFESLLKMLWKQLGKEPDLTQPNIFSTDEFSALHKKLVASTLEERLKLPGLAPMRAEYIVYGSILIETVLNHTRYSQITYSDHALKEGFLAELTQIE